MIILTFKTNDVLDQIDDWDIPEEMTREEVAEKLKKWIEYSEYISVQFDLDKMESKVLPLTGE